MPDAATVLAASRAAAGDLDDNSLGDAAPAEAVSAPPVSPPPPPLPEIRPETRVAATMEALMAKARRTDKVVVHSANAAGEKIELELTLTALDGPSFDALVDKYPATKEQAAKGAVYNGKKFVPAFLSEVVTVPHMSPDEWQAVIENPAWAGGEISSIFSAAWALCNAGLEVSFTGTG